MERWDISDQVELIREVCSYIDKFKGSTFVIKISNEVINHPDFPLLTRDLSTLHRAGIHIILVPGARQRVNEILSRFEIPREYAGDTLICPPESMDLIKMAAFDTAHKVMTALSEHQVTVVMGNWIRARGLGVIDGVDMKRSGRVDRVRIEAVTRSLQQGHIPLFPCIGHNASGHPYNLSANELAKTLSVVLGAQKLFFITTEDGPHVSGWKFSKSIPPLDNKRIYRLSLPAAREFLSINKDKQDIKTLETAIEACQEGVVRVHLIDGRIPGVLLKEIFSNLGMGTMIYDDDYERIRPMEREDIPSVLNIMRPLITAGLLVDRSRQDLENLLQDYVVYAMDGLIHGCAALHPVNNETGEIAGLAVEQQFTQLSIGIKLMRHLEQRAGEKGLSRLVALTTKTTDWFLALGFQEGDQDSLPEEKKAAYNIPRNSRILVKDLIHGEP